MRNALKQTEVNSKLSSQDNDKINSAIMLASSLLDNNQQVAIDVLEDQLKELESIFESITIAKEE